ncbi:MAG: glycosyltransferase family 2 protein [Bacteroides sp.]|nr:glycosyltransferase family 2 protein [Bacteroides sp.]MDE7188713.1 glycosyltransferase family 2 protein [Muribaculaceae bacterium]
MKELSVIILNWNGLSLLERFLPAAVRYTNGAEVELIVADNGSTDSSVSWIHEHFPEIRVIELGKNYGFAEGYNRAIAQTDTEFTVLLNSDVEVTEGWWQPLLSFMRSEPQAGACQPKIKSLRQPEYFEYAGAAGGLLDRLGYPYCRGRLFESVEKDNGQYDGPPARVAWASGAALMVRTSLYRSLGGLDADFFAHMEEIDLCCRMQAAGYGVYALTDCEVFHLGGASLNYGDARKTYLNFRNNLLLLHKNLPDGRRGRMLLWRRLADTLAFGAFLAKADWARARAVLKAHNDFRTMRRRYTEHPKSDFMASLPGARRWAVWDRYVRRMTH